ncbi:MAG: MarR family transcriptional regulator [Clostridia bacterium]|nr:MarR family transcriptional regulator [Clostridia bacterium]
MSKFMKTLNNISRSQAIYRHNRISATDLQTGHYAFVLAICRSPGRSQEDLAQELCINKSTVARNLTALEEKGYISRTPLPNDRRQFSVYPTEKMLAVLPEIKKASNEWMTLLSEGIDQEELEIFNSVLERMQKRAREIISQQEENK